MIIQVPFQTVRRIVQLADIHIRLFKRHNEFRECFAQLYSDLRATDLTETVIVVAGDIVHTKTELSPEMVELASEFLNTLANLAPTIVIAGNHDLNMANPNRLDALTPIIANIGNASLHYLKHSGVYSCADVDFYVCSIIGEQVDWPKPRNDNRKKIALFHGPIHNAQTDVGYTVTNRHVQIETFDGFDVVMLGDIHRHQILQECTQEKPIIVYASSLVQQNHGESLTGHGWCDWNVKNCTFTFRELKNTHGFYTLRIENGVVPQWDDMPENVHLRIFAGAMEQADIKRLVATIRAKRNVKELSVSTFDGARRLTTVPGEMDGFIDVADVNLQNRLLIEYLAEAMPNLSSDVIDRVIALNKETNDALVADDMARKVIWQPLSLKYDNLFTYGESNSIDFRQLAGVIGVFAPNASGKTSIAEAICFALYDRTPRTIRAANIMNTRRNKCQCEFRFELHGIEYVIVRTGSRNKKGEVKIDVDFYKVVNGQKVSLNGEERRYTNQNIRSYVGDFEDFLLTTFSSSSQQGLFVDRGQSDRKDLLSQFLGLNIFDKLHTSAADESKEVQGALKRFKNDDFTQQLVDAQAKLDEDRRKLHYEEITLDTINTNLNEHTVRIQAFYEQKTPITKTYDIDALNIRAKQICGLQIDESGKLMTLDAHRSSLTAQLATARGKLTEFDGIEQKYKEYQRLLQEKERAEAEHRAVKLQLKSVGQQLIDLRTHEYDPTCEFCVKNGANTIAATERVTTAQTDLLKKDVSWTASIGELAVSLGLLGDVEHQYQRYQACKEWVVKAEGQVAQVELTIEKSLATMEAYNGRAESVGRDIAEYNTLQTAITKNAELDVKIQRLEEDKRGFKRTFNFHTEQIRVFRASVAVLEQQKQDMLDRISEAEELETKFEVYEAYLAAVCRDGLPYQLIADVLPNLEIAVNEILHQIVEFTLGFETDGKNINIKIRYDEDRTWPLELASGMEKFVSSLAIRVALTRLSSLPKSNFLIIDEGLGTLDQDNLSSMYLLFNVLRTHFDFIFLISHVDETRDIADSLVEIKRKDGYSHIEVA